MKKKVDSILIFKKPKFRSVPVFPSDIHMVEFFRKNGYVLIPNVLSSSEVDKVREIGETFFELKKDIEMFSTDFTSQKDLIKIPFKENIIKILNVFYKNGFAVYPNFTLRTNLYSKWHIDKAFWNNDTLTFSDEFDHIQCGIYLQSNDTINRAGFDVIPKSHINIFKIGKNNSVLNKIFRYIYAKITTPVSINSKAGDLILFDARLIHQGTQSKKNNELKKIAIYWSVSSQNSKLVDKYSKYLYNKAESIKSENTIQSAERFKDISNIEYPKNFEYVKEIIDNNKIKVVTLKNIKL